MNPRQRIIKLLLNLLASPNFFTKKRLLDLDMYNGSHKTLKDDLKYLKLAGIDYQSLAPDYKYAILIDNTCSELKHLEPLNEADKSLLFQALKSSSAYKAKVLINKLETVFDFQKLGLDSLRKPNLEKIKSLEYAKKNKKQVILQNYKSNSNVVSDRIIEVFDFNVSSGIIQSYDVDKLEIRHFKMSRMERVIRTQTNWQFEHLHKIQQTDAFRIVSEEQVWVRIGLNVRAYNNMIETYPGTKSVILPDNEENRYEFAGYVNRDFIGICNFIMNNAGHVNILEPNDLRDKIRKIALDLYYEMNE